MYHAKGQLGTQSIPTHGVRCLLLIDGNEVFPELRTSYGYGDRGCSGSTAALRLHEEMRRWVSSNLGEESIGNVQLFVDLARLSSTLSLPLAALQDFARDFSSAPRPSACIDCLQRNIHAVLSGHLAFQLSQVEVVFLAGFTSDLHSYWLQRILPLNPSLRVVLVQGDQPPSPAMARLLPTRTSFHSLRDVRLKPVVRDNTGPPNDAEAEVDGLSFPKASPVQPEGMGRAEGSPTLVARPIRPIESFATSSPWAPLSEPPSQSASTASQLPTKQRTTAQFTGGWGHNEGTTTASPAAAHQIPQARLPFAPPGLVRPAEGSAVPEADLAKPAAPPSVEAPSLPQETSPSDALSTISATSLSPSITPSFSPSASPSTSQPPISPTTSSAQPRTPQPRAPPVPAQYLPLLRIVLSLEKTLAQSSSSSSSSSSDPPPAPLWSAVGTALSQSEHKGKYGKLQTYLLEAQRNGWVTTGKGSGPAPGEGGGEGSEWVRVSQRGLRAMKKVK